MPALTLTSSEVAELVKDPASLFRLANYHDAQQLDADSIGLGICGNAMRAHALRDHACTLVEQLVEQDPDSCPPHVIEEYQKCRKRDGKPTAQGAAFPTILQQVKDHQAGQWWVTEIEAMLKEVRTDDRYRAVYGVLHSLLRLIAKL